MEVDSKIKVTYIIKIYRNERVEPHGMVGVIKRVGGNEKRAFLTLEDLFHILIEDEYKNNNGRGF
ncbi:MAG: hypothetical protein GXO97_09650 [Nitrospirae bacterium]|nr:hypothetical protein [Nitrospirota bacterium]